MVDLQQLIADRILATGSIGFDEYMAAALYAPGLGFYRRGGGAGRRRDFLTSPEVGPLFGAVLARALDAWWDELGRPASLPVVEAGAGPGTLARTILAAEPACLASLELVLVEVGESQWDSHPEGVTTRAALPAPGELGSGPAIVLANELLDNLPALLVERTSAGWAEVRVGLDGASGFVEVLEPLDAVRDRWCDERVGEAVAVGSRFPVQLDAAAWLGDALAFAGGGRVVVIDYCSTSPELARRPWQDWLRTYAGHDRAGHPLQLPGSCDITMEVAIDQLALVREPGLVRDQRTFLRAHGIEALVEAGRAVWEQQGWSGGVSALAARSRAVEAEALLDPAGLGAFAVLEWFPSDRTNHAKQSKGM